MDRDLVGSDDFEGCAKINLDSLKDQMKHDLWFELKGMGGEKLPGNGRIRLVLQWIHSNVTFFADLSQRYETTLTHKLKRREKYQYLLQKIKGNFEK